MTRTLTQRRRSLIVPAVLALAMVGALQPAPAKASSLLEVTAIGVGIVAGACVVGMLTSGVAVGAAVMETAAMTGLVGAEAAGAGAGAAAGAGAGAGAGAAAAETGMAGGMAMAHHLAMIDPWRTAAVVLGGLTGGYIFGLPFGD